jgi:hypothetical protein
VLPHHIPRSVPEHSRQIAGFLSPPATLNSRAAPAGQASRVSGRRPGCPCRPQADYCLAKPNMSSIRTKGEDSFCYNWSELTVAPVDWFRFDMVTQRTRVYQSEREIQRGVIAGVSSSTRTSPAMSSIPTTIRGLCSSSS